MVPGTASRLAHDELLAVRQFIDEGGRLLYTGQNAGFQYAFGYEFDLERNQPCDPDSAADGCIAFSDDFLQYYLGAYAWNDEAGPQRTASCSTSSDPTRRSWALVVVRRPEREQPERERLVHLDERRAAGDRYPQFTSWAPAKYDRPGGAFAPHTGEYYAYSQIADVSYKRLTRTIDLTGVATGNLSFWISRDTEQDWDYVFVEAHTVGQDDWTTLPDANRPRTRISGRQTPTCRAAQPAGTTSPVARPYQTLNADRAAARPAPRAWHAATGSSGAWEQWSIDLPMPEGRSRCRSRT